MSMNGCPLREWESDQIRMEATQVEVNFLAKAIIGDFYLKLSKSRCSGWSSHHIRRDNPALGTADVRERPNTVPAAGVHKWRMPYPSTGLGETL